MTFDPTQSQQAFPKLNTPFVMDSSGELVSGSRVVNVKGALIAIPWYRLLITLWNRTGGSQGGATLPTGAMSPWAGPTLPTGGWLFCDGTAVSRTQYSDLFTAIGTTWGAGDGSTTFNLPDTRNRVLMGAGAGHALGTYGGTFSKTIGIAQMPPHSHVVDDPMHSHGQNVVSNNTAGTSGSQGASAANDTTVGTTAPAATGITLESTGGGNPLDITPAYFAANMIIKT